MNLPRPSQINRRLGMLLQQLKRRSQPQQSGEVLRLKRLGFTKGGSRILMTAHLRKQHTQVGVAHRRFRRQAYYRLKTLFRFFIASKFAVRETPEVVER